MSNFDLNQSPNLTINELWSKKAHYGGKKRYAHPKMVIYTTSLERKKYYLDLNKTLNQIEVVEKILRKIDEAGKKILFVATKPRLRGLLGKYISQTDHYYVDNRWLGGLLTNFEYLQKRILLIQKMINQEQKGLLDHYTKKELLLFQRKKKALQLNLQGIINMKKLPDYLFVIDPSFQHIAIKEAKKLGIPILAMLSTASNPTGIKEIIPINDNSPQVLELIMEHFLHHGLSLKNNNILINDNNFQSKMDQGANHDKSTKS